MPLCLLHIKHMCNLHRAATTSTAQRRVTQTSPSPRESALSSCLMTTCAPSAAHPRRTSHQSGRCAVEQTLPAHHSTHTFCLQSLKQMGAVVWSGGGYTRRWRGCGCGGWHVGRLTTFDVGCDWWGSGENSGVGVLCTFLYVVGVPACPCCAESDLFACPCSCTRLCRLLLASQRTSSTGLARTA